MKLKLFALLALILSCLNSRAQYQPFINTGVNGFIAEGYLPYLSVELGVDLSGKALKSYVFGELLVDKPISTGLLFGAQIPGSHSATSEYSFWYILSRGSDDLPPPANDSSIIAFSTTSYNQYWLGGYLSFNYTGPLISYQLGARITLNNFEKEVFIDHPMSRNAKRHQSLGFQTLIMFRLALSEHKKWTISPFAEARFGGTYAPGVSSSYFSHNFFPTAGLNIGLACSIIRD